MLDSSRQEENMSKKYLPLSLFLITCILLAGCQPAAVVPTQVTVPTQEPLSTNTPVVVVITATPFAPAAGEAEQYTPVSPFASPTASVAPTSSTGPIKITSVEDRGNGTAIIHWEANGTFPSGFQVVWSSIHENPTYPDDSSAYASEPGARSALISGKVGTIYYARVCRYNNGGCDQYSNVGIFALKAMTPTATKYSGSGGSSTVKTSTSTPAAYNSKGTPISSTASINITKMVETEPGKAHMYWTASGTFAKGFKIVYSKTDTTPTYGENSYYAIASGTIRDAFVDGANGTKYYYRVCRFTGTTCDIYSNTYTFTYSGTKATNTTDPAVINITSIVPAAVGQATVTWTATGTFPSGFKIVFSKTNTSPTLSDSYVYISNGAARTGTFSGSPGSKYYVRVCKYYNSACVAYSPTVSFTFPTATATTDPAVITITSVTDGALGQAVVNWDASGGTFPDGFKVMYSDTNAIPTPSDTVVVKASADRTATIDGIPGTTYYVAVCKIVSGTCGKYSNIVSFHFAADTTSTLTGLVAADTYSGAMHMTWSSTGTFPEGINILASASHATPTMSDYVDTVTGTDTSVDLYSLPGTTYYIRLCKAWDTGCTVYSNTITFTFANIVIESFVDNGDGTATVNWTKEGSFPDGFLVVSDETNNPPDPATDTVVTAASGDTSATISGTAGTTHHVMVCQSNGSGGCLVESEVSDFTFSGIAITTAEENPAGTGHFAWTKSGDFSNGISLIYSMEKAVTTIGAADGHTNLSGTATGTDITTSPAVVLGTTMHYRVCQLLTSTTCSFYSDEVTIAYAAVVSNPTFTDGAGQVTLDWTNSGSAPADGWVILRGDGATDPIRATSLGTSSTLSYTDNTIVSGSAYTYRVCGLNGSNYTSCSPATAYTAP
jgi:hypothetical protein